MRPGQPFVVTVGPLAAAAASGVTTTTKGVGVNNAVVINGTLTDGQTANNVCLTQTPGGAGALVLNGSLASAPTGSAIAYLGSGLTPPQNRQIYFTFAADESARTFTISGLLWTNNGLVSQSEVLAGSNTSIQTSRKVYWQINSILVDAATTGALTVGRQGVATMDQQRQIAVASAGNDTGITFTLSGTDGNSAPISETITGATGASALTTKMFKTITSIVASNSIASTITVGTTGIARSIILYCDRFVTPFNIGLGCTVTGTVNFDVQHTFDDVLTINTPVWFANSGITGKTGNQDGNYAFPVIAISLLLNSGSGTVKMTAIQADGSN
jgi:hypothetical protein